MRSIGLSSQGFAFHLRKNIMNNRSHSTLTLDNSLCKTISYQGLFISRLYFVDIVIFIFLYTQIYDIKLASFKRSPRSENTEDKIR